MTKCETHSVRLTFRQQVFLPRMPVMRPGESMPIMQWLLRSGPRGGVIGPGSDSDCVIVTVYREGTFDFKVFCRGKVGGR